MTNYVLNDCEIEGAIETTLEKHHYNLADMQDDGTLEPFVASVYERLALYNNPTEQMIYGIIESSVKRLYSVE